MLSARSCGVDGLAAYDGLSVTCSLIRRTKDGNEGEDENFSGVTGSRGARASLDRPLA